MGVSKNKGTPKSSISIWFSNTNHPFWGTPIFGNIHIPFCMLFVNFVFNRPTLSFHSSSSGQRFFRSNFLQPKGWFCHGSTTRQGRPWTQPRKAKNAKNAGGSLVFLVHPYLGKWSNLTNIFQMGWNHQLEDGLARVPPVVSVHAK